MASNNPLYEIYNDIFHMIRDKKQEMTTTGGLTKWATYPLGDEDDYKQLREQIRSGKYVYSLPLSNVDNVRDIKKIQFDLKRSIVRFDQNVGQSMLFQKNEDGDYIQAENALMNQQYEKVFSSILNQVKDDEKCLNPHDFYIQLSNPQHQGQVMEVLSQRGSDYSSDITNKIYLKLILNYLNSRPSKLSYLNPEQEFNDLNVQIFMALDQNITNTKDDLIRQILSGDTSVSLSDLTFDPLIQNIHEITPLENTKIGEYDIFQQDKNAPRFNPLHNQIDEKCIDYTKYLKKDNSHKYTYTQIQACKLNYIKDNFEYLRQLYITKYLYANRFKQFSTYVSQDFYVGEYTKQFCENISLDDENKGYISKMIDKYHDLHHPDEDPVQFNLLKIRVEDSNDPDPSAFMNYLQNMDTHTDKIHKLQAKFENYNTCPVPASQPTEPSTSQPEEEGSTSNLSFENEYFMNHLNYEFTNDLLSSTLNTYLDALTKGDGVEMQPPKVEPEPGGASPPLAKAWEEYTKCVDHFSQQQDCSQKASKKPIKLYLSNVMNDTMPLNDIQPSSSLRDIFKGSDYIKTLFKLPSNNYQLDDYYIQYNNQILNINKDSLPNTIQNRDVLYIGVLNPKGALTSTASDSVSARARTLSQELLFHLEDDHFITHMCLQHTYTALINKSRNLPLIKHIPIGSLPEMRNIHQFYESADLFIDDVKLRLYYKWFSETLNADNPDFKQSILNADNTYREEHKVGNKYLPSTFLCSDSDKIFLFNPNCNSSLSLMTQVIMHSLKVGDTLTTACKKKKSKKKNAFETCRVVKVYGNGKYKVQFENGSRKRNYISDLII